MGLDAAKDAVATAVRDIILKNAPDAVSCSHDFIYNLISRPPDKSLGDLALPCFQFAKILRQKPPEIAVFLSRELADGTHEFIQNVGIAGAFLNLTLDASFLGQSLVERIEENSFFRACQARGHQHGKVMIEYSQPNTHKVFHVGHMRNVALGDSLRRLYEYCGFEVIAANYIGDEGAHIAKCLWHIDKKNRKPASDKSRGAWLGDMYAEANLALDSMEGQQKEHATAEISNILRQIETNQGAIYELWLETREWSMALFREVYNWLDARFDLYFFESEMTLESHTIVDEYLDKGTFKIDQGAVGIDLSADKCGFALLRKSDGNTLYLTKDLALAKRKFNDYSIESSIYVVASEQNLHFKQAFKILERMGFKQSENSFHLSYGMVVGKDGKMSSRKGNVIPFDQLRETLELELHKKLEKYKDTWSEREIAETIKKLSVGSIKYGMLCSDAAKDIVFDIDDWISFDGNTGPYLMYAYARSTSILKRAKESKIVSESDDKFQVCTSEEHELVLSLGEFNEIVVQTLATYKPSTLSHYLFDLCKCFSRFHKNVSVLKGEASLVASRLRLVQAFQSVLGQGLELLGIDPPERM